MVTIRHLDSSEYGLLRHFMWLAVHLPGGAIPELDIVETEPRMRVYWVGFGSKSSDLAVCTESASGQIIGMAWARSMDSAAPGYGFVAENIPELAIAVDPQLRGQGIGQALLTELLTRLASAGYAQVSLAVVQGNRAKNLYDRAGFSVQRAGGNDYIMVKTLIPRADQ